VHYDVGELLDCHCKNNLKQVNEAHAHSVD
jgi:hypothetical protein